MMRFAGCAHATTLDLAWMRGRGAAPAEDSEHAELLQRHGDADERVTWRGSAPRAGASSKFCGAGVPLAPGVEDCNRIDCASTKKDVPRAWGSSSRSNASTSRSRAPRRSPSTFAAPRLLDARCATVEEVRLVTTLCALPVAAPAALGEPA